jgi:hypothetical protein
MAAKKFAYIVGGLGRRKKFAYLLSGIGIGIYTPKIFPKLTPVKLVKFYKEVFAAQKRLRKIVIEEYERIDEAIQAETEFLKMINPHVAGTTSKVTFEVTDDGKERDIKLKFEIRAGEE